MNVLELKQAAQNLTNYCIKNIEACQKGNISCIFYDRSDFPHHCSLHGRPAEWYVNTWDMWEVRKEMKNERNRAGGNEAP